MVRLGPKANPPEPQKPRLHAVPLTRPTRHVEDELHRSFLPDYLERQRL
jgi:hypothetical protein